MTKNNQCPNCNFQQDELTTGFDLTETLDDIMGAAVDLEMVRDSFTEHELVSKERCAVVATFWVNI